MLVPAKDFGASSYNKYAEYYKSKYEAYQNHKDAYKSSKYAAPKKQYRKGYAPPVMLRRCFLRALSAYGGKVKHEKPSHVSSYKPASDKKQPSGHEGSKSSYRRNARPIR
jgi:hypothetical protein